MTSKSEEIAALYATEHDRLERQISRRVGCRSTAGDLVQDIFLRLWERAIDWKGDSAAYLSRCARNAAIDHIRAERTRAEALGGILPVQVGVAPAAADDLVAARQAVRSMDQALAALPRKTRHVFFLNRIHGRSFAEIAMAMGMSKRAVEKHMARAVRACSEAAGRGTAPDHR